MELEILPTVPEAFDQVLAEQSGTARVTVIPDGMSVMVESKPPLKWRYAQALEGHNTGMPLKRHRKESANRIKFYGPPLKRPVSMPSYSCYL